MKKKIVLFILITVAITIFFPNVVIKILNPIYENEKVSTIIMFIEIIVIGLLLIYSFIKKIKFKSFGEKLYKEDGRLNKKEYYREIPCNGNLVRIFWIAQQYGLLEEKSDLIGAMILKWVKDGKVDLINNKEIAFKKEVYDPNVTYAEKSLRELLREAAGPNEVLEEYEIQEWMGTNKNKIKKWFKDVAESQKCSIKNEGLIFSKNEKLYISKNLDKEANEILSFKNFLKDYSLLHERYPIEVELWEDYLIVAQVLGIAEKVKKELKNIYPDSKEIFKLPKMQLTVGILILMPIIRLLFIIPFLLGAIIAGVINGYFVILLEIAKMLLK